MQAMAPVAMQCFWSMRAAEARLAERPDPFLDPGGDNDDLWRLAIGTCHVWAADGPAVAAKEAGTEEPIPVFLRARFAQLGIERLTTNNDAGIG